MLPWADTRLDGPDIIIEAMVNSLREAREVAKSKYKVSLRFGKERKKRHGF